MDEIFSNNRINRTTSGFGFNIGGKSGQDYYNENEGIRALIMNRCEENHFRIAREYSGFQLGK
jgi:hypothetical protein